MSAIFGLIKPGCRVPPLLYVNCVVPLEESTADIVPNPVIKLLTDETIISLCESESRFATVGVGLGYSVNVFSSSIVQELALRMYNLFKHVFPEAQALSLVT